MFSSNDNRVLDEIIAARQTCRKFSDRVPSKEDVSAVIEAGRLAPYAIASAKDVEIFRHFFVLFRGNPMMEEIDRLIRLQCAAEAKQLRSVMDIDPFMQTYAGSLEKNRAHTAEVGLPVFPDPPCLIIVAEWRGARRAERQDLAHAMQNMWLKATALNLDFCIMSPVEDLVDTDAFCSLFDLPTGRYGFHACVLGYREVEKLESKRHTYQVHWM